MKILLTGHTKGIGQFLLGALSAEGHVVIGVSRSNGYDISLKQDRDILLTAYSEVDVFINNAHAGTAQCELALGMWNQWHTAGRHGYIINVGSKASYDHALRPQPTMYDCEKSALRNISIDLSRLDPLIRVTHLAIGYVDTDRNKDNPWPKLAQVSVIDIVKWLLSQPSYLQIREICCEARTDEVQNGI